MDGKAALVLADAKRGAGAGGKRRRNAMQAVAPKLPGTDDAEGYDEALAQLQLIKKQKRG
jgi:hypothetical protein